MSAPLTTPGAPVLSTGTPVAPAAPPQAAPQVITQAAPQVTTQAAPPATPPQVAPATPPQVAPATPPSETSSETPAPPKAPSVPKRAYVKTTMSAIIEARAALMRMMAQPVDITTAKKLLGLKRAVNLLGGVFGKERDALTAKIAESKLTPGEQAQKQNEELAALMNKPVALPRSACITTADLAYIRITANDLDVLSYAILDLE